MTTTNPLPARTQIDPADTWNLEALYAQGSDWETEFGTLPDLIKPIEGLRGKLNSAQALADLYQAQETYERTLERLWTYASNRANEDIGDSERQARKDRLMTRFTELNASLAWIEPELLELPEETLQAWADSPELADNRYALVRLIRRKPHTLSLPEETLLAKAAEIFGAPGKTYSLLSNADLSYGTITDSEGNAHELTDGRYVTFLEKNDRTVRKQAFSAMWAAYGGIKNTCAATLASSVKIDNYRASVRNFPSALAASLHNDNITVELYDAHISAVRNALPAFHNYMGLRRQALKLDKLDMYDLYVCMVPDNELKFEWEQSRDWIIDSCAPLGPDYVKVLRSAYSDRWMDIYENKGKRSGAYSSGCYDSIPYILLNYDKTLNDVFTVTHELGHSLHTHLANSRQSHRFSRYPIFIAEIASTLNEALLLDHLLNQTEEGKNDPAFRASLLNHYCDGFKGTVYRQTMFAEFEKIIHEKEAEGEPLTVDTLCDIYLRLNTEYYGPHVDADPQIALEWARIPHFYHAFYVYKYATSFCASSIFVDRVLAGESPREKYLDLLRAGGSGDPLDLIQAAGIDMTDPATYKTAFTRFEKTVEQLQDALDALNVT